LTELNLWINKFSSKEREEIKKILPNCSINFGYQY